MRFCFTLWDRNAIHSKQKSWNRLEFILSTHTYMAKCVCNCKSKCALLIAIVAIATTAHHSLARYLAKVSRRVCGTSHLVLAFKQIKFDKDLHFFSKVIKTIVLVTFVARYTCTQLYNFFFF